jgi:predicted double-glycine peptidase
MNSHTGSLPLLDVPYFQQTRTATCGPACLMMVMKYWDPSLEFSRKMEFYLWKKSYSLFMFGGTFQYGLAVAATTLGYTTEIYQKTRFSDGYPKYPELATLIERMVSHKALRLHISIQYGYENINVINDALHKNIPPIVFINLFPILGENVFHWIVVSGIDEKMVYVNDPYVPGGFSEKQKKEYPVPIDVFSEVMATQTGRNLRLPPCVVLIKP